MGGRHLVGVDEAGRGPVLGSMFVAAVAVPEPSVLPDGVDDSKRLSVERRETLAAKLRGHPDVGVGVAEVPVERIDDPGTDMNGLTVAGQAEAVGAVAAGGERVLADACDTDESRFARRLDDAVDAAVEVRAEHGADERHPVVAAASVVAKVERDAHVERLAADHGDLGSGYPGDRTTREFLAEYVAERGRLPPFARSSWRTCERLLAEREQRGIGEFSGTD